MSRPRPKNPFQNKSLPAIQRLAGDLLVDLSNFQYLVEAFLDRSNVAQTRLGRDAIDMADFVRFMREGRHFRISTIKQVLGWIATVKVK